ncbi:unnamed protein product [Haemonchus placei]|uniref:Lipase n=1 Tax=Haemonchus placei TaxID=6290 RepID=A0A0N4WDY5_HAEPC|nr:unnamed protein product [Haemonchus placei]
MFRLLWLIVILSSCLQFALGQDPEIKMTVPEIIQYWGYPVEVHYAVTQDGYILELHRIPNGKDKPTNNTKRPVVFLQHGLESSSSVWVTNLPQQSAGFVFADAGFDVWMGNMRGNRYSRSHIRLNPVFSSFWEFNWDQMAQYDLPAMIDKALVVSGQPYVYYVGHSQGSLTMFVKLSEDSSFSRKVSYFGSGEFLLNGSFLGYLTPSACETTIQRELCKQILFAFGGPAEGNEIQSRITVYLSHFPAGTSSMNILHWVQMINTGTVTKLDYGQGTNIVTYGQINPPSYNLRNIPNVPVYIFSGGNDWIATEYDIRTYLIPLLGPRLQMHTYLPEYSHFDFTWGLNAADDVYKPIAGLIHESFYRVREATASNTNI